MDIIVKYHGVDLLAMALTFIGLYLIGNKWRYGFVVASLGNISWITLGVFAQSTGLIFANIVIICLYIRGFIKWSK